MHVAQIGAKTWASTSSNWTTDFAPTPDAYYTSPDTRTPIRASEPVDTSSSVVETHPVQGYDVEAHQRLANYTASSLENHAQDIQTQNDFINDLLSTLGGSVV